MFSDALPPVNEFGPNSGRDCCESEVMVPLAFPVPGEDGEPQSVSGPAFDTAFSLVALGALMVLAVQVAQL